MSREQGKPASPLTSAIMHRLGCVWTITRDQRMAWMLIQRALQEPARSCAISGSFTSQKYKDRSCASETAPLTLQETARSCVISGYISLRSSCSSLTASASA